MRTSVVRYPGHGPCGQNPQTRGSHVRIVAFYLPFLIRRQTNAIACSNLRTFGFVFLQETRGRFAPSTRKLLPHFALCCLAVIARRQNADHCTGDDSKDMKSDERDRERKHLNPLNDLMWSRVSAVSGSALLRPEHA